MFVSSIIATYAVAYFAIHVSCLSCFLVCSLHPCGHLPGEALTLLYVIFYCTIVAFLCGVLGQVWCLIVSIPDLCLLSNLAMCAVDNTSSIAI